MVELMVPAKKSPEQRMSAVVQQWFLAEPLLFGAWSSHRLRPNPALQSIRVGRGLIEFHPDFVAQLDERTLREVMKFEALRIILKHPYERKQPRADFAYEASNLAIRECTSSALPLPTARVRFGSDQHNAKFFEYYYNLLVGSRPQPLRKDAKDPNGRKTTPKKASNQEQTDAVDKKPLRKSCEEEEDPEECPNPCDRDAPGDCESDKRCAGDGDEPGDCSVSSPCDDSGDRESDKEGVIPGTADVGDNQADEYTKGFTTPCVNLDGYCDPRTVGIQNTANWDFDELFCQQLNDLIDEIQASNNWGTMGGNGRELILASRTPRLDYRRVLRAFRASVLSTNRRLTRMKPNRRYGFQYMGSRRDFSTQLLFAVDVSGSVSSADVRNAFAIVNRLFKYGIESIDVLWFDTQIRNEKPLSLKKARQELHIDGRGGTCFQPMMEYLDKHFQYDGLIIFTDGIAPVPDRPKRNRRTRICWLFNHEDNWKASHKELELPGMTSAFVLPD